MERGLKGVFGATDMPFKDMQELVMIAEAMATVKCFDEGGLESIGDANIGSIFGIGFPAWTGGIMRYINQYEGGLRGFVARAKELAEKYGDRFNPPAEKGETALGEALSEPLFCLRLYGKALCLSATIPFKMCEATARLLGLCRLFLTNAVPRGHLCKY